MFKFFPEKATSSRFSRSPNSTVNASAGTTSCQSERCNLLPGQKPTLDGILYVKSLSYIVRVFNSPQLPICGGIEPVMLLNATLRSARVDTWYSCQVAGDLPVTTEPLPSLAVYFLSKNYCCRF
jgi:hypothetical protein